MIATLGFVGCSKAAPEQRSNDFSASFHTGNGYAGSFESASVASDGAAEYRSTRADATIRVRSHLAAAQLDALHASLRAERLEEVREAELAEIQHDASTTQLRVSAGEWSVDLEEHGGQEIAEGQGHYDAAGRAILAAVGGEAVGTPVFVTFAGDPFTHAPEVSFELPGEPPGVTEPTELTGREWTLHFADAATSVAVVAQFGEHEIRASFVPGETKRVRVSLDADAPKLGFE